MTQRHEEQKRERRRAERDAVKKAPAPALETVLTERKEANCHCGARLPTHLLFALSSHTCSCGRRWYPNEERTAFEGS